MTSGPASATTTWCAGCCAPSCGPGTGTASRRVQLRAGEWFEAAGDTRRAARHFLAGQQPGRALALLQDRVVPDFLRDPAQPAPLNLAAVGPALLAAAPDQLLALASDLLLSGDPARGGQYLDLLERARPPIPPGSALAARYARCGHSATP